MSDKLYIINKTKATLLIPNNDGKVFCILKPQTVSVKSYTKEELQNCIGIQSFLSKEYIEFSTTNQITFNEFGQDYGQRYSIGFIGQLKGDNNIEIQVLAYSPITKKYKVRIKKSGGTLIVTEKEISPILKGSDDFSEQEVEIIDNEGSQEGEEESMNADEAIRMYEQEAKQAPEEVEVMFSEKEYEDEDDFGEQIIIKKEGAKFADEVTIDRVAKDTSKEVTKKLASALKKPEIKTEHSLEVDLDKIPAKYQEWFSNFLAKDDRKKKMAISACNDKEKLMLIIQNCDELSVKLATTKLQKLNK
ncbi:MAG: hypothetical protein NC222_06235 [Staphylococcus sp.]|nr:hypothetical protein [Staphylococcus sp.]